MNLNFHINPNLPIPLEAIRNSMQLDSGIEIAWLKVDGWKLSLQVLGEVRVTYNPDPDGWFEDGQDYRHASDFPPELMKVFSEGMNTADMPNIYIGNNNWFELLVEKEGKFINSDLVDEECFRNEVDDKTSPALIFSIMWDTYLEYKEEEEEREKTLSDALLFFQGKKDELKSILKTEEETGLYPHDTVTTYTIEATGEHTLSARVTTYVDRDGKEDDPDVEMIVDGYNLTYTANPFEDLVNEVIGI